jgi:hypothetical protein
MLKRHSFFFVTLAVAIAPARALPADPDYARDVRPLLAQFCLKCHGQDEMTRKARLRLDERKVVIDRGVIVPGKPDESEFLARIFSADADKRMPPATTRMTLTDTQKDTLRRWVAAGAEYKQHWAFLKPIRPALPGTRESKGWDQNPIDAFILARLQKEGLTPSPEANRYTLIRRVALDLVGLPPTPEEVDAFVKDASPDAYEKLVDRLLASPHYGERWARRWLDLARYADTNGYEKDRTRSIWPYRDWVINALNADMPFDQFTVKQLAGDLLPGATTDDRIATGFHRNTMLNEEGGIDPLEFRFHAMTDRVATTGTVWLGLTLGCAQCHSHKYDPVSQREYYQVFAFLNNADEPEMNVSRADITAKRSEIEGRIARLIADLPSKFPPTFGEGAERQKKIETTFAEWLKEERARAVKWRVLRPAEAKSNLPLLTVQPDDSVFVSGDLTKRDEYRLMFRGDFTAVTAVRVEALPDDRLPAGGPGAVFYEGPKGDFTLSEITAAADGQPARFARASHSFAAGNSPASAAIDGNPQTGWSINGGQGQRHVAVFVFDKPLGPAKELTITMLFERYFVSALGRFRIAVTTAANPEARNTPADVEQLLLTTPDKWSAEQNALVRAYFHLITPHLAAARKAIDDLRKQLPSYPTTLVLRERPPENPRPTFTHNRGDFLQPREKVEPATPAFLPPLPKDMPRNRLGFARWLVSPENPLTARVTVNRQWAAFFGRGLVRTTEDFGFQGESPSHPELLDYLAVELMQRGWSLKKLHRLIVLSATYRQASRVTPELKEKDPTNVLLARGPRVRLEAELIRDAALKAAGLLSPKLGGPSVFPPQPASVTTEGTYGAIPWKASEGEDRYRRSLYTFAKRTAPFALFTTFDAPSGEACVARRDVSNTPMHALFLLNDVVFVEAAQALGRLIAGQPGSVEERVEGLFRRLVARAPTDAEKKALVDFFTAEKKRFATKEQEARKLAGEAPGFVERAAWTALARVLLNLDEFVTKN